MPTYFPRPMQASRRQFLTAAGTIGYMRLEGFHLGEAVFMTVTVLSTVGLQPRPLGPGGQMLTEGYRIADAGSGIVLGVLEAL